jgi:hypothetical protein
MRVQLAFLTGILAAMVLPAHAADGKAAANGGDGNPEIPADLKEDEIHILEELGVNEFTAPSISKLFDTLTFLMPIPLADTERPHPDRKPVEREDIAIELGFLIADGFLIVQAEQLDKIEGLANELTRFGKQLGTGDRMNRQSAALLELVKDEKHPDKIKRIKELLSATQRDVEKELISLKDADLAHLISLGGWIRALEVSSMAVHKQFSAERARKVMREDIADYYTESVAGLEPRISERPSYVKMRDLLAGMRSEMVLKEGEEPTPAKIAEIKDKAKELANLALQRKK